MATAPSLTKLWRQIPDERRPLIERMERILNAHGCTAEHHEIEAAWMAACLRRSNRPDFALASCFDDEKLYAFLRPQLSEIPDQETHEPDEEIEDEDAGEEQDDGGPAPREADREPAQLQERIPLGGEVVKRRGRPPGKAKKESI